MNIQQINKQQKDYKTSGCNHFTKLNFTKLTKPCFITQRFLENIQ